MWLGSHNCWDLITAALVVWSELRRVGSPLRTQDSVTTPLEHGGVG